jgi:hypothetical protein
VGAASTTTLPVFGSTLRGGGGGVSAAPSVFSVRLSGNAVNHASNSLNSNHEFVPTKNIRIYQHVIFFKKYQNIIIAHYDHVLNRHIPCLI